jgi:hypothetical protein
MQGTAAPACSKMAARRFLSQLSVVRAMHTWFVPFHGGAHVGVVKVLCAHVGRRSCRRGLFSRGCQRKTRVKSRSTVKLSELTKQNVTSSDYSDLYSSCLCVEREWHRSVAASVRDAPCRRAFPGGERVTA